MLSRDGQKEKERGHLTKPGMTVRIRNPSPLEAEAHVDSRPFESSKRRQAGVRTKGSTAPSEESNCLWWQRARGLQTDKEGNDLDGGPLPGFNLLYH